MSLRDSIFNKFWLKLFSLALAFLLWFAIQSNLVSRSRGLANPLHPAETRDFRRPIAIMTSAANRRAFRIEPSEVDVRVGGTPDQLKKLNPHDILVQVKLVEVPNPQGSFPIEVTVPPQVSLQQVWPRHIYVEPVTQD